MKNFFKNLFGILKGFGWKKYLMIILLEIVILAVIGIAYYWASLWFNVNIAIGIIAVTLVSAILIGTQYFIYKKTFRN